MKKEPVRLYKDIDMKFGANFVSGDIAKKYDIAAIRQSMKNIIYTRVNERPFDPTWGSQVHQLLYEPIDSITSNALRKLVVQAIENHEPRVKIETVTVDPKPEQNEYIVNLYFFAIGIKEIQQMDIVLSRLR